MKITEMVNEILNSAEFVDMTRMLEDGMPYWPTQPKYEAETIESLEKGDSSYFRKIVMCEHTGTHIDAGCHFVQGKESIDEVPVTQIIGRAVNIDVTDTPPCGTTSVEKVKAFEKKFGEIQSGDIVFFRFGWDEKYESKEYLQDWPGISLEVGKYLYGKGVKAIGCDAMALDAFGTNNPNHPFLLGNGVNIVENVDKLGELPAIFSVIGLPCRFKGGSGSTLRLVALIEKDK